MFDVFISGVKVNRYIDYNSLDEYEQITKGEGAFDYRVETIDFDADDTILQEFNVSSFSVYDLREKLAEVYYYGSKVLYGMVKSAEMDFDTNKVYIEFHSLARILSDLKIEDIAATSRLFGIQKTLEEAMQDISLVVDRHFSINNLPVRMDWRNNIINPVDFSFLRSITIQEQDITGEFSFDLGNTTGITCSNRHIVGIMRGNNNRNRTWLGRYVVAYRPTPAAYFVRELTANGLSAQGEGMTRASFWVHFGGEIQVNEFDDDGILDFIEIYYNFAGGTTQPVTHVSKARNTTRLGDYFWVCTRHDTTASLQYNTYYLSRITVTPDDIYNYDFKEGTVGEALRAFAMVSNSIVNVNAAGQLVLINRDGIEGLTPVPVISASYAVEEFVQADFEIPANFIMTEDVRTALQEYFNSYYTGKLLKGTFIVNREDIPASEFPIMHKKFTALIKGVSFVAGTIVNATFKEQFIEIQTEKYIG